MAPVLTLKSLLLLSPFLTSHAAVLSNERRSNLQIRSARLQAFQDPAPNEKTENYLTLTKRTGEARSAGFLNAMRGPVIRTAGTNPLISMGNVEYLTPITFNNQQVQVIVDTGSSDTWLIKSTFQCVDKNSLPQTQASCNFGPLYTADFGNNKKPYVNFNIGYGDGEFLTGEFGTADITIAGITVPDQLAALGTKAYWRGDATSTGLLGLAYSDITSQYSGSTYKSGAKRIPYDPIFTTMFKTNLSTPMFSMAIERETGGYLAFGGLPPVETSGEFATVPIETMTTRAGGKAYQFYTLTPDAFVYHGAPASNKDQYIVDSGTTLFYAASTTAKGINAAFVPPATNSGGLYTVDCSAKAPDVSVKIGGQNFKISAKDLILNDSSGTCTSGVQDGGSSGPFILGDVFMRNAVVIFDVGAAELRFGARPEY